jgi:hypothetical protein
MGAEIVTVLFQLLNDRLKCSIAIKTPGEEKRCFYFLLIERGSNIFSSFGILIAGKYQGNLFFCTIAANDRSVNGFQFFFTPSLVKASAGKPASLAASR